MSNELFIWHGFIIMSVINAFENFFRGAINVSTGFPVVDLLKKQKTKICSFILKDKNAAVFLFPLSLSQPLRTLPTGGCLTGFPSWKTTVLLWPTVLPLRCSAQLTCCSSHQEASCKSFYHRTKTSAESVHQALFKAFPSICPSFQLSSVPVCPDVAIQQHELWCQVLPDGLQLHRRGQHRLHRPPSLPLRLRNHLRRQSHPQQAAEAGPHGAWCQADSGQIVHLLCLAAADHGWKTCCWMKSWQ